MKSTVGRTSRAEPPQSETLGLRVESLSEDIAQRLRLDFTKGAVITAVGPDSPASRAGLEIGMVISRVNRDTVETAEDFVSAIEKVNLDEGVLLLVRDSSGSRFIVLTA